MISEWKPISRAQETFLALPDTLKEGFFGGSAGPGKSEILMMYPIARGYYKHPRFKALFMRRTYGELKLEIIPRSRELYTAFGGKFNKSDLVWDFSDEGGGLIFFGYCEHESDVHRYDSMEINLFLPDELQTFLEYMYLYIGFTRVRSSVEGLPAIIRAAGMPGNIGHNWVNRRFIKPAPDGGKVIVGKAGNRRIFIFSTLRDNPRVSEEYARSLEELPEAEKRAKKYGDWSSYEGQVFEEFRDKPYPEEPDNALHCIPPFEIPEWWPRYVVIDWGYNALTYCTFNAISPTYRVYVYREMAWKQTKIEEWAPAVRYFIEKEHISDLVLCKSAGQHRGQEHTIQEQISNALGISAELTANTPGSRISTKTLLHEYLRWRPKPIIPQADVEKYDPAIADWTLRNFGEAGYKDYLSRFEPPKVEKNLPKLLIFTQSPEGSPIILLPEALKACTYAKTVDGKPAEDVNEFEGDDPYDNIRYVVDWADRFFNMAEDRMKQVEQRDAIARGFEIHRDWNRLFQESRALEAQNSTGVAVQRYRRR